ncbi:hypothetical protein ACFV2H_39960 [Streptomyces sp. NPDC059629]|uniref:hypothetical protein n=1 Tax=Streptomyces sp. NPDC059629 TaxID=3346889 RepID=UPI0036A5724C
MEFIAACSVDGLSLAARCIEVRDFHLAVHSIRRAVRLIDFARSVAALGREFPEGRQYPTAQECRTPDDSGPAKVVSIVGGNRRAAGTADPGPQRQCPSTGRETELLGRLRQVAAELWEAFGGAVESVGATGWEQLGRLTERQAPVAPPDGRLAEAAEIYRVLVELNAAALHWERIHWCDRSSGSDSWCTASGISPLFPVLPPAPGMPAPGTYRGATSW